MLTSIAPIAATPPALSCPVCGAPAQQPFRRRDEMQLYECPQCRLVHLFPMPDAAALYHDTYDGASTGYFTKVPAKEKRARGRMAQMVRALGRDPHGLDFLDIGCNGGFMVEAARLAGFNATGLEPDSAAVRHAQAHYPKNIFINGLLEQVDLAGRQFDLIYCSEVIEHVADCQLFTRILASLMRPGALLYLTTPDMGHWRRPRDLDTWDAWCPPSHCLYFNPRNLTMLLQQHGLRVERRRWAFKPGIKFYVRKD